MTIHSDAKLPKYFDLHWYTIQYVLGTGGFGITYLAKDNNLNREVAIKEFYPRNFVTRGDNYTVIPESEDQESTYEWGLQRFLEEAQTLARFKHRNIVSINSVFQANHSAYIVMEYIHGTNLKALIKQGQKFSENEIRSLIQDICGGLQLVHKAGFIHRDIKPGNILLKDATTPVLIDFGSARLAIGTKTQQLTTLVSVGYAPSEQYDLSGESEKQGPWSDIYALGATTYELMTGNTPVDVITRINDVMQGKKDPVLAQLNKNEGKFSEELIQAVASALLLNPNDRPQSLPDWWRILDDNSEKLLDETSEIDQSNRLLHQALNSSEKYTTGSAPKKKKNKASITPFIAAISVVGISMAIYFSWNLFQDNKKSNPEKIISSLAEIIASDASDSITLPEPLTKFLSTELQTASKKKVAHINQQAEKAKMASPNQQIIDILLAQAKQDIEHFRLTTPKNKNAYFGYQHVFKLDANNETAKAGIAQIANKYALLAERKLTQNDLSSAQKYLDKIKMVDPNHDLISALEQKIEVNKKSERRIRQEIQRKNELLKIAKVQMEKGNFYFPFSNSAYNYFLQVLQSDPENPTAKKNMVRMESDYRASIQQDIANQQYEMAKQKIQQIINISGFTGRFENLTQELNEKNKTNQQQLAQRKKAIEIQKWLDTAHKKIIAKQYLEPADSNALTALRKAMKLDPDNEKTRNTLRRLQSLLLDEVSHALDQNNFETARVKLQKAAFQELANSPELMQIKAEIDNKEKQSKQTPPPQINQFDFLPPP